MTHIVHLSDTHVGDTADLNFGGAAVLPRLRVVIDAVNALDIAPEFVIHTGDIVDDPSAEAYRRAADVMAERLPGARRTTLPRAGHIANIEEADAFNEAVLGFLNDLSPAPAGSRDA